MARYSVTLEVFCVIEVEADDEEAARCTAMDDLASDIYGYANVASIEVADEDEGEEGVPA